MSSDEAPQRDIPWWETLFTTVLVYWMIRGEAEQITARLHRFQRRMNQFPSQRD